MVSGGGNGSGRGLAIGWALPTAIVLGIGLPVAGTLVLNRLYPGWSSLSLPLHSTLEVGGAILGLVLAVIILFSQRNVHTSRRMWVSCALISMAVFDIFHSCVPAGNRFVWLHSVAVLAGGIFFSLVWFSDRNVSRKTALGTSGVVLLSTALFGLLSSLFRNDIPRMLVAGSFTPAAHAINFTGGGLTLFAAINFAARYYKSKSRDEMLYLLLALLFGGAGVLFYLSEAWQAGWWFWHVLRLGGYAFAFWLAMLTYRTSENETLRAHNELNALFNTAADGKRIVDRDFVQLRTNATLNAMAGVGEEAPGGMKCYDVFSGPLCHTAQCPLKEFETSSADRIEREVKKRSRNGQEYTCVLNATRLRAPDGSFRGIVESFWDITDRKEAEGELERQAALKTAQAELADRMRGAPATEILCRNVITFLCEYLGAQTGLVYLAHEDGSLALTASYAHRQSPQRPDRYRPGEGLVGQAALDGKDMLLANVPEDYFTIESGLGETLPRHVFVKPVAHNGQTTAVIELGTLEEFGDSQTQFLDSVTESIAIAIESAQSRAQLAESLEESQALSEELQAQQEELRTTNEELEEQTQRLQESEEELKAQQEELQVTNEELEEKNRLLERRTVEVDRAKREIEEKAEDLALASKYKSEFLANMSHELRTPLNSLLLLAQSLAENKEGNLTEDQVESAGVIHSSGSDLLNLINEILDLSKIEAGRMDLTIDIVPTSSLAESVRASFAHMAEERGLSLQVGVNDGAPAEIRSDRRRVEQVVRNLVSNALKFTESGGVTVTFGRPGVGADLSMKGLDVGQVLAIAVQDTGIGIAAGQQKIIFEAFQQADGGTSRKFGGTGLGLSISRELAGLLGGEIRVESEPGKGSTFTLYLPVKLEAGRETKVDRTATPPDSPRVPDRPSPPRTDAKQIEDDREKLSKDDRTILVIEDDPAFARLLLKKCHEKGCKCLAAPTGEDGLELATEHLPNAVILDLRLPGMDGWTVLNALKEDTRTRHIPVHVVSVEEASTKALRRGAVGHAVKPLDQEELEATFRRLEALASGRPRRLLVVDDDARMRRDTVALIGGADVEVDEAASAAEATDALRSTRYDCVVLDLGLPDMDGRELLIELEAEGVELPPVIVHTARDLTEEEEASIRERAESVVIKDVRSQERLLDEVSLFLHRVVSQMPPKKRKIITDLHDTDALLRDKKVLVVDDDMRTTFALSRLLTEHGMRALKAENGERALRLLDEEPDVDLVLMDVMMPVLDGYEAMRRIRAQERFRKLPIIALTAKAMKEDREKCLEAGASEYMPKPVDPGRLISLMRVWLHR